MRQSRSFPPPEPQSAHFASHVYFQSALQLFLQGAFIHVRLFEGSDQFPVCRPGITPLKENRLHLFLKLCTLRQRRDIHILLLFLCQMEYPLDGFAA